MDWGFLTHHLVSGYIPVMVALVVYFILMHVIGKKQTIAHIRKVWQSIISPVGKRQENAITSFPFTMMVRRHPARSKESAAQRLYDASGLPLLFSSETCFTLSYNSGCRSQSGNPALFWPQRYPVLLRR